MRESIVTGIQLAYERVVIAADEAGVLIDSDHVYFGGESPPLHLQFALEADWTPRRMQISSRGTSYVDAEFNDYSCIARFPSYRPPQTTTWATDRANTFVFVGGVAHLPLHLGRRYRYADGGVQRFRVVPPGLCEVQRLPDTERDGQTYYALEVHLYVGGLEDRLELLMGKAGEMERCIGRRSKQIVTLETARRAC